MSSLPPHNMFDIRPHRMTEDAVRDFRAAFFDFVQRGILFRIENDPGYNLLTHTSYGQKRADLMECFDEIRRMHDFFNQHYRYFEKAKYKKAKEVLEKVFGTGMEMLENIPTFPSYYQYKHDYTMLRKGILEHIEACRMKTVNWVDFDKLTSSTYTEGKDQMLILVKELNEKNMEFFKLILMYHTRKNGSDHKTFASSKSEYDRLMDETMSLVEEEEKRWKFVEGELEEKGHVLDVLGEKVNEKASEHSVSQFLVFRCEVLNLGIPLLHKTSEGYFQEWCEKIRVKKELLRVKGEELFRMEVKLTAIELGCNFQLGRIPRPGLSLEAVNRIDSVSMKIQSLAERCSKLNEDYQCRLMQIAHLISTSQVAKQKGVGSKLTKESQIIVQDCTPHIVSHTTYQGIS